jgi:excinuclease UvrABC nuclease subunit
LTGIKGIGSSTAQKLLKELGSLAAVKQSNYEKLAEIIGKQKAEFLIKYFEQTKN